MRDGDYAFQCAQSPMPEEYLGRWSRASTHRRYEMSGPNPVKLVLFPLNV